MEDEKLIEMLKQHYSDVTPPEDFVQKAESRYRAAIAAKGAFGSRKSLRSKVLEKHKSAVLIAAALLPACLFIIAVILLPSRPMMPLDYFPEVQNSYAASLQWEGKIYLINGGMEVSQNDLEKQLGTITSHANPTPSKNGESNSLPEGARIYKLKGVDDLSTIGIEDRGRYTYATVQGNISTPDYLSFEGGRIRETLEELRKSTVEKSIAVIDSKEAIFESGYISYFKNGKAVIRQSYRNEAATMDINLRIVQQNGLAIKDMEAYISKRLNKKVLSMDGIDYSLYSYKDSNYSRVFILWMKDGLGYDLSFYGSNDETFAVKWLKSIKYGR